MGKYEGEYDGEKVHATADDPKKISVGEVKTVPIQEMHFTAVV